MKYYVKSQNCVGAPGKAYRKGDVPMHDQKPVEKSGDYQDWTITDAINRLRLFVKQGGVSGSNALYYYRSACSVLDAAHGTDSHPSLRDHALHGE